MPVDEIGLKRWQFRKKKKVEKRRQKRQLNAEKNQPKEPVAVQSKRWHDTLLNLPMMPTQFTLDKTHKSTFKTFVQSDIEPILVPKKTYRERFLERKQAKKKD
ncbi:hypothetical protein INT48_000454 [Thamnidium elegans]|uniref:Uncharacterized protein n=1 Tax=Thamnidium elegans TaxID=101142 RepID=A0A8H7SSZ6_9FUNG|nr:hypothetical protein INT48_000454 [Thamnidium elegans]